MRRTTFSVLMLALLAACGSPSASTAGAAAASRSGPSPVRGVAVCRPSTALAATTNRLRPSHDHPGVTEFVLPAGGGPTAVAPAPGNGAWVTEEDAARIALIGKDGAMTEWTLPRLTAQPGAYSTADGQGGVWFPERGAAGISHLDAAGNYRTCRLPFSSEPFAVSLQADGQVWFADFSGSTVGRMDSSGKLVYWSLTGHLSQPAGVQLTKDGTAWVTDYASNRLARIDSQGRVAFAHLPTAGGAMGICLASDGTIWIAQSGADRIARIGSNQEISDIKLTSAGTHQPQAIAQAGDGSLWFTESRANRLGHIPVGETSVAETGELGRWPDGIAVSGQTVWFTEYDAGAIGFVG